MLSTRYIAPIHLSAKRGGVIRPAADCPQHGVHTAHPDGGCVQCRDEERLAADLAALELEAARCAAARYLRACRLAMLPVPDVGGRARGYYPYCTVHRQPAQDCQAAAAAIAA